MDLRVFIVEDLHNLRTLLAEMFAALGGIREAGVATTEAEARLWLDEHPGEWDVAIVDLVLDQGSGIGVLRHIQQLPGSGKVVVFSSYTSPGIRDHCLYFGAAAVFDKAVPAELIAWLRQQRGDGSGP